MLRYDLNPKSEVDYTSLTSALCLTINTAPMSKQVYFTNYPFHVTNCTRKDTIKSSVPQSPKKHMTVEEVKKEDLATYFCILQYGQSNYRN